MPAKENVITKTEDFIQWFLPKIDKFPRSYKFLFGDRIIQIQLDLLEQLIEAYFRKDKLDHLKAAITIDQYAFASRGLNGIGGLVGGWVRFQTGKANEPA